MCKANVQFANSFAPPQQFYFYTRQRPHIIGTSELFILRRLLHIKLEKYIRYLSSLQLHLPT